MNNPTEYKLLKVFGVDKVTGNSESMSPCIFVAGRFGDGFYSKQTGIEIESQLDVTNWEYLD